VNTKTLHPRTFLLLALFGAAMGVLEAVVVVYLREIYFPQGFDFPLVSASTRMLAIEWVREITTVVMLVCVALIAGRDNLERFCSFIFAFGVWDIAYYTGLKAFLDWPPSLLTWDVLFLIPIVWVGPVLAPLVCSVTMIGLALCLARLRERTPGLQIAPREWALLVAGALLIFCTFVWDFTAILVTGGFLGRGHSLLSDPEFLDVLSNYRPERYNWYLLALGELLTVGGFGLAAARARRGRL
jgi:hypothetical protein